MTRPTDSAQAVAATTSTTPVTATVPLSAAQQDAASFQRLLPLRRLLVLHRWLGIVACTAILMFASSGLLHPIMSRTQPQPVQRTAPPATPDGTVLPLASVLRANAIDTFIAASSVQLPEGMAYRVQIDARNARYFNAASGAQIGDGERLHAETLARYFSGSTQTPIIESNELADFDADYPSVNRLLPVWRIRFASQDSLAVYVDTKGDRLATIVDDRKRVLQKIFRNMHDFAFLDTVPLLRLALMLVLLGSAFATACFGLALYGKLKNPATRLRNSPARRWHRRLSLPIALTTLSFSVSGTWHLLQSAQADAQTVPPAPTETFSSQELSAYTPPTAFALMQLQNANCYRINGTNSGAHAAMPDGEHAHHAMTMAATASAAGASCIDAVTGTPIANADRDKAERLARYFSRSGAPVKSSELIDHFSGEYGFINKRLPVWRIVFADSSTRWYIETSSNALALRADNGAALEGFFFAYVHKWTFFGEHKDIRDALMMLFALGNIVVALLGLSVFIARRFRLRTD